MAPGVDDDLHGGDEFRFQQQKQAGQRDHHHDQRDRAMNGMALHDDVHGARHGHRRQHQEDHHVGRHLRITTARLVSTTFSSARGKRNFHPKRIS